MDEFLQQNYEASVREGRLPEGGFTDEHARQVNPFDLLSSNKYTTSEQRNDRLDICKDCDELFKPTRTCKHCGCFMALKTWLKDATCPLNKWSQHKDSGEN